jgi:division protein CdvB (Snf7/Vps24/ESCRT-III family)
MKLCISILFMTFLLVSCAVQPQTNKPGVATVANTEKNRQIALKNEVTEITRVAQKIEQQGRAMDSYRALPGADGARQCATVMDDLRKQTADLEARIKNLPENFSVRLTPIIGELNECVACAKQAIESCKKSRALINQAIKEIY